MIGVVDAQSVVLERENTPHRFAMKIPRPAKIEKRNCYPITIYENCGRPAHQLGAYGKRNWVAFDLNGLDVAINAVSEELPSDWLIHLPFAVRSARILDIRFDRFPIIALRFKNAWLAVHNSRELTSRWIVIWTPPTTLHLLQHGPLQVMRLYTNSSQIGDR